MTTRRCAVCRASHDGPTIGVGQFAVCDRCIEGFRTQSLEDWVATQLVVYAADLLNSALYDEEYDSGAHVAKGFLDRALRRLAGHNHGKKHEQ